MNIRVLGLILLLLGFGWLLRPQPTLAAEGIAVTVTMYTCDNHPNNPMYPCGPLRWGGRVSNPGMACPVAWKNRYYEVPGYGVRRCDDTGAYDYYNGRPHIDIRVPTYAEASRFGIRRMVIYPASSAAATTTSPSESPAPTPAAPAAPAVPTTPEQVLASVMELAPEGDASSAQVKWLRLKTVREHFPTLVEDVDGSDDRALWVVTLWVPPTSYDQWTQAVPTASRGVAGRFFLLDVGTGEVLESYYISPDITEIMGWLPSDPH